MSQETQTAYFAGGCFWCVEAVFSNLKGIEMVVSGYTGGKMPDPTYEQICQGDTGHAEAVKIVFDPEMISYRTLLEVFFSTHDPTQVNRQGNDAGEQYRSAVFYVDQTQKNQAEEFVKKLESEKIFDKPIATKLEALDRFYQAEGYHQEYFRKNPDQAYCQAVINPKLQKLRAKYAEILKN